MQRSPLTLLLVLSAVQGPATRGAHVTGRIVILEKDNKPSPDLDDAVLYLEGNAAAPVKPVTVEIAITDKTYAPHVVDVPVGSTVRFPNHDPFHHNVFSVSEPNQFDLGLYGRGDAKSQTFRSEEHTSELQSRLHLVCRLLLEKKKKRQTINANT